MARAAYVRIVIGLWATSSACGCAPTWCEARSEQPPTVASVSTTVNVEPYVGTPSCSARGCHGSIDAVTSSDPKSTVRQNEYTRWLTQDQHARAYQTLFNDRSKRIARLLNECDAEGKLVEAHQNDRCLACHTGALTAAGIAGSAKLKDEALFGIGCESCHGPARDWLEEHTLRGWRNRSDKTSLGMTDLNEPAQVVAKCAGCHIGSPPDDKNGVPPRDVNHDLIAAGHPRMNFEFTAYMHDMPEHFLRDGIAAQREPTFEAKAWMAGQLVTAEAALRLLAYRAANAGGAQAKAPTVWPEFAEYDCTSCHHDLQASSWRQAAEYTKNRRLGSPAWGTWYFEGLPTLTDEESLFADVRQVMQSGLSTSASEVAPKARKAAEAIAELLKKTEAQRFDGTRVQKMLRQVGLRNPKQVNTWDAAAQTYLALAALQRASMRCQGKTPLAQDDEKGKAIEGMFSALNEAFQSAGNDGELRGYDTPRFFGPSAGIRGHVEKYRTQLERFRMNVGPPDP